VGENRLRAACRMKIKRKIRDKYKIQRIFVAFFICFSKPAAIQNGGSVAAQSPISRRGSNFSRGGQYEALSPRQDASISAIK